MLSILDAWLLSVSGHGKTDSARACQLGGAYWMLRRIALHNISLIGELTDRQGRKPPQNRPILSLQNSCVLQIWQGSRRINHDDCYYFNVIRTIPWVSHR